MGEPLTRRFHQILTRSVYSLIAWLLAIIVSLTLEAGTKSFSKSPEVSVTFFLATLPLYAIVMFGCHSLLSIGYHMIVLGKCPIQNYRCVLKASALFFFNSSS